MRIRQTASPRQQLSQKILYGFAASAALALALAVWFKPSSSTENNAAELSFYSDNFDYALAQALAEDKLCLVKFGTGYCYPCERLDALIFSDPALKSLLRERFIPFRVDPWDPQLGGSELAQRYDVEQYPTLLVTDSEGNELWRLQGAPDAARLSELLSRTEALRLIPSQSEVYEVQPVSQQSNSSAPEYGLEIQRFKQYAEARAAAAAHQTQWSKRTWVVPEGKKFRVVAGPFENRDAAQAARKFLKSWEDLDSKAVEMQSGAVAY